MRRSLCLLMTFTVFFVFTFFLGLRDAAAVRITNKSEKKIGAALLRVKDGRKSTLFVKILQPKGVFDFAPSEGEGSLLVSVKVFDTNETLRVQDAAPDARLSFENGRLVDEKAPKK